MANKKRKDGYIKSSFTEDGKRYYVYGKNQREVNEKINQKRNEIEQQLNTRTDPTIKEYFEKRIEYKKNSLTYNTIHYLIEIKDILCKIYIKSAERTFGEIKIKQITADDLRYLQLYLSKRCSTSTTNSYMKKLKQIMNEAIRERIIIVNPFDLITNLKRTEEKARDTYHRALSVEEQAKFFNSELLKTSIFRNVIRMGILTGMRIGEIGALKYKDIKSGYIEIKRTVTRVEGHTWGIGEETKTKAGKRKIPITEQIREVLEDQNNLNTLRKGNNIIELEELVFVGPMGGLTIDGSVNKEIKKICEHENIKKFTFHALRDTFATRAIEGGMKPRTLQEILGHKDFAITMNLYCHVLDDTKEKEMNNLRISI